MKEETLEKIPYEKGITMSYLEYATKDETYLKITNPIIKEIIDSGKSRFKSGNDVSRLFWQMGENQRGVWAILQQEQRLLLEVKTKYILD